MGDQFIAVEKALGLFFVERVLSHEDASYDDPMGGGLIEGSPYRNDNVEAPTFPSKPSLDANVYGAAASSKSQVPAQASDFDGVEFAQEPRPLTQLSAQDRLSGEQYPGQHRETLPLTISSLVDVKIVEATCGDTHLLLLSNMGELYALGVGRSGQLGLGEERLFVKKPVKVFQLPEPVKQIAAGAAHSVALSEKVR